MTRCCHLDLSVTNQCNAHCIYCPTPRIKSKKRFLGLNEINKLIDNLLHPRFLKNFGYLRFIEIGGLAEPLLHPNLVEVLRLFKKHYPTPEVSLYTNALLLNRDSASEIIRERLITSLIVSIDGLDSREHRAAKGIDYERVASNLINFIKLRNRYFKACQLVINVLTYKHYCKLIQKYLGRTPLNVSTVNRRLEDNTVKIIKKWKRLCLKQDVVRDAIDNFQLRAEYPGDGGCFPVEEKMLKCPWPVYVAHSICITSDGDWISCCNDFYKENIWGNFLKTSCYEIASSERRINFIKALIANNSAGLPGRCKQKKYCQPLNLIA